METSSREEPEQQAHQPPTDLRVAFGVAVAIQVLALLIMVFGDIGFDRAGRFGLDFGHGLLLALIWVAALAAGFLLAWRARHPGLLSLQTVLLLLTVGGGLLMAWAAGVGGPISPADQQHVPR